MMPLFLRLLQPSQNESKVSSFKAKSSLKMVKHRY